MGITVTPTLNALTIAIAAPLSILLAMYAWGIGESQVHRMTGGNAPRGRLTP